MWWDRAKDKLSSSTVDILKDTIDKAVHEIALSDRGNESPRPGNEKLAGSNSEKGL